MKRLLILCPILIVFAFATFTQAQVANNTALVGTVLDSSGSAVVGAKVTAVEESTGVVYPGTTNAQGYYSIKFIPPGTYDISVEQTSFNKLTKTGTIVPIDQAVRTDFSLKAGSETQTVTVSASTPPIQTDDATIGETFDTKAVQDLPLMGHNALEIAATASNVTIGPSSGYSNVPPGEDFIGAGQREIQSSMTLDGVSIMNNLITTAAARPSSDMISEVQMQSGNYPAQYGSYLGLHVNLVSKSGTNDLHGAVYDYIQNTALNAHDFFDQPGAPKPINHYNQYGFALGGPVYFPKLYNGRNRTFFFGSWEKLNQISESTGTASTLTQAERNGDFSAIGVPITDPFTGFPYPNNQIPTSELNSPAGMISQKLEKYMTLPNLSGVQNNLHNSFPNNLVITQTLDRVDENIGDKDRLYFRYHWQNITITQGTNFPTNASFGPTRSRNYAIGYTHIFRPNLVNDFRVGLNTVLSNSLDYFAVNGPKDAGTALGIPGFNSDTLYGNPGLPSIYVDVLTNAGGGPTLGNTTANWYQDDRTIDGYDELSYTRGRHNIMAGLELRKLTIGREAANDARGFFNFNGTPGSLDSGFTSTGYGAADFVLGLAQSATTPVFPTKGSIGEWRDGFFVLDNWQVMPKLTLNYGLRYELPTVPYSLNGYTRILNATDTALIPATTATTPAEFKPTPGFKFINPTHNDWAPRLGFAYRATETTVLRGGFGIYWNANQLNTYTLTTQNYPLSASVAYNGQAKSLLTFASPTPNAGSGSPMAGIPGTYVNAVTMGPHLPTQELYQWNLSWGQELWKGAGAELQYIGSHAIHLDRDFYNNSPLPGGPVGDINGRRPNQLFGRIRTIQNDEYSHYNGFTAILRQRTTHGLSGQASYTWSHDLDLSDNSNNGGTTMNQYNINLDYASSNWDIRNRFVGIANYDLPKFGGSYLMQNTLGGWQVNAIVTLQTGIPYNVYLDNDQANVSQPNGNVQRPNWVHVPSAHCTTKYYISNPGGACIDGSAFEYPAQFTFGTGHRNPLYGPGFENVNASLFKEFGIWERLKFQFRAEAQNVFNHPNLYNPNSDMQGGWDPNDSTTWGQFGTFYQTQKNSSGSSARVLQLAGKIVF